MSAHRPTPGREREQRLGAEGLARLERQLQRGSGISDRVLRQWVRRYGAAAEELIGKYRSKA